MIDNRGVNRLKDVEYVQSAMDMARKIIRMDERNKAYQQQYDSYQQAKELKRNEKPTKSMNSPMYWVVLIVLALITAVTWNWWALFKYGALAVSYLIGGVMIYNAFCDRQSAVEKQQKEREQYQSILSQEEPTEEVLTSYVQERYEAYETNYIKAYSRIPSEYMYLHILEKIHGYLEDERATTLGEALNLYDMFAFQEKKLANERYHQTKMEGYAKTQAEAAQKQVDIAKQVAKDTEKHNQKVEQLQKKTKQRLDDINHHIKYGD